MPDPNTIGGSRVACVAAMRKAQPWEATIIPQGGGDRSWYRIEAYGDDCVIKITATCEFYSEEGAMAHAQWTLSALNLVEKVKDGEVTSDA